MRKEWRIALWAALGIAAGCVTSHEASQAAPDCGCDEPDSGECEDTDVPDTDTGVLGWRMTWATQAGGNTANSLPIEELAWDLEPLSDGAVVAAGRYVYEGLFGAG